MNLSKIVLSLSCLFAFASCASLISEPTHPVTFSSNGEPKEIVIYNARTGDYVSAGKTPTTVVLPASDGGRRAKYNIVTPQSTQSLNANVDGWYWTNIINIIGFGVDFSTGAMWQLPYTQYIYK